MIFYYSKDEILCSNYFNKVGLKIKESLNLMVSKETKEHLWSGLLGNL